MMSRDLAIAGILLVLLALLLGLVVLVVAFGVIRHLRRHRQGRRTVKHPQRDDPDEDGGDRPLQGRHRPEDDDLGPDPDRD